MKIFWTDYAYHKDRETAWWSGRNASTNKIYSYALKEIEQYIYSLGAETTDDFPNNMVVIRIPREGFEAIRTKVMSKALKGKK